MPQCILPLIQGTQIGGIPRYPRLTPYTTLATMAALHPEGPTCVYGVYVHPHEYIGGTHWEVHIRVSGIHAHLRMH